jgi:hypothetical protein
MTSPGFRGQWFTIGRCPPADGEGDGSGKGRSDRTELEFDRPFLFHEARTDTGGSTPRMTSMGQEKMSHTLSPAQPQVTIGIDISKDRLDVHLHPAGLTRQFTNDRKGHAELIAWAKPHCPSRIVFEATGAYHRALEMALGQAGLPAVKVNPLQVRRFAEAIGKRAKTDPVDAATLARFGTVLQPEVPLARDATLDQLAEVLAARRAQIKDRTAARNRGKTLTLALLKRQNKCHLQQIEAQIRAIDEAQAAILAGHAALQARFDILLSVPGLGAVTALALLIDMPEPELWVFHGTNALIGFGGRGLI